MRSRIGASGAPLQLQSARHRVAGTRERNHEAIAFALFDRPHTIMGGDDVGHRPIQQRDRSPHLVRLGLPQSRGALDVGEHERHRSRRQQLAHNQVAPVHRRRLRAGINLAHASQHAGTAYRKTPAHTRIYDP
jgi:hypothetical protein